MPNRPCRYLMNHKLVLSVFFLVCLAFEARGADDALVASQSSAAEDEPSLPHTGRLAQRLLAVGDFAALNEVWKNVTVPFPDQVIVESVAGTEVTVNLTGLTCTGWDVGDVQLMASSGDPFSSATTTTTAVQIEMVAVDVQCQTRYSYDSLLSGGTGSAFLVTRDNQVSLNFSFYQPDAAGLNVTVTLDGCDSDVNIEELELEPGTGGGGLGTSALERLLRSVLNRQISKALCRRAADVEAVLQDGLDQFQESLGVGTAQGPDGAVGSPSDPLIAEVLLDPTVDWLNVKDPESSMEGVVSRIVFEQPDLWIGVLWDQLLVENGLDLNLQGQDFAFVTDLANVTLRVLSARIQAPQGASPTVSNLTAVGFATLSLEALLPTLSVQLGLEVEIQAGVQTYVDTALVGIPLSNVAVALTALVAVDEGRLGNNTVGSVLFERWNCFFSALRQVTVHEFKLQFGTEAPTVSGMTKSPGLKRLLEDIIALGFDLYGNLLDKSLVQWIQDTGQNLDDTLSGNPESGDCSDIGADRSTFIDFRDLLLSPQESVKLGGSGTLPYGSLLSSVKTYVTELLADESSVSSFVDLAIASGSESLAGSSKLIMWTDPLVDYFSIVKLGNQKIVTKMKVDQLTLENAVSFSQPQVLDPIGGEPFSLNNSVSLAPTQPLRVSARVLVKFDLLDDGIDAIENKFILGVELQSVQLAIRTFAKVYAERVMSFPVEDVLNWRCWMATVLAPTLDSRGFRVPASETTLSISEVDVVLTKMSFFLDCVNCTGQKFDDLSGLLDAAPTDELARESALNVVDYLISLVEGDSSALQIAIDRMLVEAPKYCPHCDEYNPYANPTKYASLASSDSKPTSLLVMVALLVLAATLAFTVELWSTISRRRKHRRWLASLSESERRQFHELRGIRVKEVRAWNDASDSLLQRKEASRWVRWLVPVVIIGNCALFLSGHLSPGGEVRAYLYFGGQEVVLKNLYSFSIAQICLELWRVGSRGVSVRLLRSTVNHFTAYTNDAFHSRQVILILFAIVWPYVKQLLALLLWVVPPRLVNVRRRGSILQWLDFLAKWSMLGTSRSVRLVK
jgi:hypothetical protein